MSVKYLLLFLPQEIYLGVTKEHLTLSIRRLCFIRAALCVVIGIPLTYFGCYMPCAKLCGFPTSYIFPTLTTCLHSYWIIGFNALAIAGSSLTKIFKVWNKLSISIKTPCVFFCVILSMKFTDYCMGGETWHRSAQQFPNVSDRKAVFQNPSAWRPIVRPLEAKSIMPRRNHVNAARACVWHTFATLTLR
jgi:hypothetical protein